MNQLRYSLQRKNSFPFKYFLGAVVIILFIFLLNIFSANIKDFFSVMATPLQQKAWGAGAGASQFVESLTQGGSLLAQNKQLEQQNQTLLAQVASLQAINNSNQQQSDISAAATVMHFQYVTAGVIGLTGQDILRLNQGSANGIQVGMAVVNGNNVLFGKIYKVSAHSSDVQLISSSQSVVNVETASQATGSNLTTGVVRGQGSLGIMLDLVPTNAALSANDVLTTSALDKEFPKGLLIGVVTSVKKNDQQPFQQASVSPYFDLNRTSTLFVITNYNNQ